MTNYIAQGRVLDYTNGGGSTIPSGSVVVTGAVAGIAVADILVGDTGAVNLSGAYQLTYVTGADGVVGRRAYWDTVAKVVTLTANANTVFLGTLYYACGSGDTTCVVNLIGSDEPGQAVFVAQIATADATDLASSEALANANKASLNSLLTALKNAGLMARA